jgi:hypothetical protein
MIFDLPKTLTVNGTEYPIRTDFRDVLNVLVAFEDPNLEDADKVYVCMTVIYEDFKKIPEEDLNEAYRQAIWFIDNGKVDEKHHPKTMDWEQDATLIFPAVNKVAGFEVRAADYIHWWTFLGYFMEIGESSFSTILSLRQKKAKGKSLDKWEREFWSENADLCKLKPKLTEEEEEEKRRLLSVLG